MKLGVVATILRWDHAADQWLRYHRAIGFERFYVFCDGPAPTPGAPGPAGPLPGLALVNCDADHWRQFGRHPVAIQLDAARRMGGPEWREPDVRMLRQSLNVDLALQWAQQEGVAWLLHIDGDELFDPGAQDLQAHFAGLDTAGGVEQARYLNKEAIVTGEGAEDFFADLTLFKMNPRLLSDAQRQVALEAMGARPYFLAYVNGKSAMYVLPGTRAAGVHGFRKAAGAREHRLFSEPSILHYPYGGYARFRERHEAPDAEPIETLLRPDWQPPKLFAIIKLPRVEDRPDALRPVFKRWVVLDDAPALDALMAVGIVQRVERPSQILQKVQQA